MELCAAVDAGRQPSDGRHLRRRVACVRRHDSHHQLSCVRRACQADDEDMHQCAACGHGRLGHHDWGELDRFRHLFIYYEDRTRFTQRENTS